MKNRNALLYLGACALLTLAAFAETTYEATLSGDNEVPPVATDASGAARVEFNDDFSAATFSLEVSGGVRVTQAHIHCAPPGVNGPVVAFLAGFHDRGWDVDGPWVDNATLIDANVIPQDGLGVCPHAIANLADLAAAVAAGDTYVNVHTHANPPGEVRGQLGLAAGDDDDDDDNAKVEICHAPSGDPANARTISVGATAVDEHLAHGDWLGPCDAPQMPVRREVRAR